MSAPVDFTMAGCSHPFLVAQNRASSLFLPVTAPFAKINELNNFVICLFELQIEIKRRLAQKNGPEVVQK
jgi:hypothetical protein